MTENGLTIFQGSAILVAKINTALMATEMLERLYWFYTPPQTRIKGSVPEHPWVQLLDPKPCEFRLWTQTLDLKRYPKNPKP